MKRSFWCGVVGAVLAVTASAAVAQASLLGRLPADTILYAEARSLAETAARLKEHPVARMLADEEVKEFLAPLLKQASGMAAMAELRVGVSREELASAWKLLSQGRVELVVLPPPEGQGRIPVALLRAQVEDEEAFRTFLGKVFQELQAGAPPGVHIEKTAWEGRPGWSVRFAKLSLALWVADGWLVLTTDAERAEELLGGQAPPAGAPLAASEPFRAAREALRAAGADCFCYANMGSLLDTSLRLAGPQAQMVGDLLDRLGLQGFECLGFSWTVGRPGVTERIYVGLAEERTGLAALMDVYGTGLTLPEKLPADTVLYGGARVRLLETYERLVDMASELMASMNPGQLGEFEAVIEQLESGEMLGGLKLRDELLAALGEEYALSVAMPEVKLVPDVLLLWKLRDRQKASAVLEKLGGLLARADLRVRRRGYRGLPLYMVSVPGAPIMPTATIRDDLLVIGLFSRTVRKYLAGHQESLAAKPEFRRALELAGVQDLSGASEFLFLDLQRALRFGYENLAPYLATVDPEKLPPGLDLGLLPTADAVVRHFEPVSMLTKRTERGCLAISVAPVPAILGQVVASAAVSFVTTRMERRAPPIQVRVALPKAEPKGGRLGVVVRDAEGGCEVEEVEAGGAAERAGIRPGDLILACDGRSVADTDALAQLLARKKAGDTIKLRIRRGDTEMVLEVTLQ